MRINNKRALILDSAFQVVELHGARHLTIDAVAATSGVSKGGVLYHFSTKADLLSAMLQYLIEVNRSRVDEYQGEHPSSNKLSALIQAREHMTEAERRASLALLAAAAEEPDLLSSAGDQIAQMFEEATDGCSDKNIAAIFFLANEGLRFLDLLGLNPIAEDETSSLVRYLSETAETI